MTTTEIIISIFCIAGIYMYFLYFQRDEKIRRFRNLVINGYKNVSCTYFGQNDGRLRGFIVGNFNRSRHTVKVKNLDSPAEEEDEVFLTNIYPKMSWRAKHYHERKIK